MSSVIRTFMGSGSFASMTTETRDVVQKLAMLRRQTGNAVIRRGLLAGSRVIGEDARRRAPQPNRSGRRGSKSQQTRIVPDGESDWGRWAQGRLRKAIGWETRGVFRNSSGEPIEHRALVFIRKPKTGGRNVRSYAHFVEHGTRPHAVGKGSIARQWKRSTREVVQKGGMHPGARPRPFMRPAFEAKKFEAFQQIVKVFRRELEVEVAKLSRLRMAKGRAVA